MQKQLQLLAINQRNNNNNNENSQIDALFLLMLPVNVNLHKRAWQLPRKSHATASQQLQIRRHFQPDAFKCQRREKRKRGGGREGGCRAGHVSLPGHGHH